MRADERRILLSVARCSEARSRLDSSHPCSAIVGGQQARSHARFQLPEPWRGDIRNAPLLFVSSNPGLGDDDDSLRGSASDGAIVSYYERSSFPSCFPRNLRRNGEPSRRAVTFWSAIRARAAEVFARPRCTIQPGRDFALTEVVHCKSQHEHGVGRALGECISRHFESIATLAGAGTVVLLGHVVAMALGLPAQPKIRRELWYGRQRTLVWLPHPNARTKRTFAGLYADDLASLRADFAQQLRRPR